MRKLRLSVCKRLHKFLDSDGDWDGIYDESDDYGRTQGPEIVVLQIMCFGDKELLVEYVEKQDWDE